MSIEKYIADLQPQLGGDGWAEEGIAFANKLLEMIAADETARDYAERGWSRNAFNVIADKIDWRASGEDRRFWADIAG